MSLADPSRSAEERWLGEHGRDELSRKVKAKCSQVMCVESSAPPGSVVELLQLGALLVEGAVLQCPVPAADLIPVSCESPDAAPDAAVLAALGAGVRGSVLSPLVLDDMWSGAQAMGSEALAPCSGALVLDTPASTALVFDAPGSLVLVPNTSSSSPLVLNAPISVALILGSAVLVLDTPGSADLVLDAPGSIALVLDALGPAALVLNSSSSEALDAQGSAAPVLDVLGLVLVTPGPLCFVLAGISRSLLLHLLLEQNMIVSPADRPAPCSPPHPPTSPNPLQPISTEEGETYTSPRPPVKSYSAVT